MEKLIGTTKAAELADCDSATIRRACEKQQIEGVQKIGNDWIMTVESVEQWKATPDYHTRGPKRKVAQ